MTKYYYPLLLSVFSVILTILTPYVYAHEKSSAERLCEAPPRFSEFSVGADPSIDPKELNDFSSVEPESYYEYLQGIHILVLEGTHYQMGKSYGKYMKEPLRKTLDILLDHFVDEQGIALDAVYKKAQIFHKRYSQSYELFLTGMAEGSGLSLQDCIVLNGMETLNSLKRDKDIAHCSFVVVPAVQTLSGSNLIGRNYDFPAPYNKCTEELTLTILRENNKTATAIIGLPGQMYCPTCISETGLFMELNNGMPSGGYSVNQNRRTLLVRMLEFMQNSKTIDQLKENLQPTPPDYSLIVNAADHNSTVSVEFSSTLGTRVYHPESGVPFVSTNFFQSAEWKNIPTPDDRDTWMGVTRRNNLISLVQDIKSATAQDLVELMSLDIEEGGARWDFTIYQIVFDSSDFSLYLCKTCTDPKWVKIPLSELFPLPAPHSIAGSTPMPVSSFRPVFLENCKTKDINNIL